MPEVKRLYAQNDQATRNAGADLAEGIAIGDVVLLAGPLGAGKTTLVRGFLEGLGYSKAVRSPTFNLIQTFDTTPPVMHADLYRVKSHQGIGIEEYLHTHVCLIEWPDRAQDLFDADRCWRVTIDFERDGRSITILPPVDLKPRYGAG